MTGSRAVLVRVSSDHTTALLIVNLNPGGDVTLLKSSVGQVEEPSRASAVTGPDRQGLRTGRILPGRGQRFASINGTLLLATAGLVFVLLIIIYRSPIFWFIPLFSVLMAEAFSRFCGWAIAEAGVTVNGQSAGVLRARVGAGTDYALLLVARYREELRRHESPVQAMRQALRRAGPAVVASGSTVIVALLCLSLAEVNGTSGLGPIGAMGVALAMLAMLTLLPAGPVIGGRRAFWPFIPRLGSEGADQTHGFRRTTDVVVRDPRRCRPWRGNPRRPGRGRRRRRRARRTRSEILGNPQAGSVLNRGGEPDRACAPPRTPPAPRRWWAGRRHGRRTSTSPRPTTIGSSSRSCCSSCSSSSSCSYARSRCRCY